MSEFVDFRTLAEISQNWEISYEFGNISDHTQMRMVGTHYPNSVTEPEFNIIRDLVANNNLQCGYEVATGFGLSTLAAGLGFKQTGGKLVTMDSYHEEFLQDPLIDDGNVTHENTRGYKSVKQLIDFYGLTENVFPTVGWSPDDTDECLGQVFGPEDKLDFVFIDAFHTEEAAIKDFDSIKDRINLDKFVVLFHDSDGLPQTRAYAEAFLGQECLFKSVRPWGFYLSSIERL